MFLDNANTSISREARTSELDNTTARPNNTADIICRRDVTVSDIRTDTQRFTVLQNAMQPGVSCSGCIMSPCLCISLRNRIRTVAALYYCHIFATIFAKEFRIYHLCRRSKSASGLCIPVRRPGSPCVGLTVFILLFSSHGEAAGVGYKHFVHQFFQFLSLP